MNHLVKTSYNIFLSCWSEKILRNFNFLFFQDLCTQLRTIYNVILKLESIEETLYQAAISEEKALEKFGSKKTKYAGFSITPAEERKHAERQAKFNDFINIIKTRLTSVARYYNDHFRKYLSMLSSSSDEKLQLLSVRLDFNGYYQQGKPKKPTIKKSRFKQNENLKCQWQKEEKDIVVLPKTLTLLDNNTFDGQKELSESSIITRYGSVASLVHKRTKKKNGIWCCIGWAML